MQASRRLFPFIERVFADGGYAGERVATATRIIVEIVAKNPDQIGFAVLPRRWVVERFFAWIGRNRRLAKGNFQLLVKVHVLPLGCPMAATSVPTSMLSSTEISNGRRDGIDAGRKSAKSRWASSFITSACTTSSFLALPLGSDGLKTTVTSRSPSTSASHSRQCVGCTSIERPVVASDPTTIVAVTTWKFERVEAIINQPANIVRVVSEVALGEHETH